MAAAAAEVGTPSEVAEREALLRPLAGRMIPMAYGAATLGAVCHALDA